VDYQQLPPLSTEEYNNLKADIKANGLREPIITDTDDNTLDGFNREQICKELRIKPTRVAMEFGSEAEKMAFVIRVNRNRRQLSSDQRKELRKREIALAVELNTEGRTQKEIGAILGVAQRTVSDWLADSISVSGPANANTPMDVRVKIPRAAYPVIAERLEAGETQEQVAADFKVTQGRIAQVKKAVDKQEERKGKKTAKPAPNNIELYQGNFIYISPKLEKFSLVIADPPYNVSDWAWDDIGSREEYLGLTTDWLEATVKSLEDEYTIFWFVRPHILLTLR